MYITPRLTFGGTLMKRQQLVIAIDLDDVIFDFNGTFAIWHNSSYDTNVTYENITNFDLTKIYNVDSNTIFNRLDIFRTQHWEEMSLVSGTLNALYCLKDFSSLHVITARCESLRLVTESMLDTHMSNVFTELHLTNGVTSINQDKERRKIDICREIGAIILIDDNPNHVTDFIDGDTKLLVPDRPWNQNELPQGVVRCGSWEKPGTDWEYIISWINSNI